MSTAQRAIERGNRPYYSVARALLREDDSFEREVSQRLLKSVQGTRGFAHHGGVMIPPGVFASLRSDTATAGKELVYTAPAGFAGALYNQPVLRQLGARFLTPTDSIATTWMTGGLAIAWQSSEVPTPAITPVDPTFAQDLPQPSLGMCQLSWTRRLSAQSDPSIDQLIMDEVEGAVAAIVDTAGISGSGSAGEPLGLILRPGVKTITVSGALTYDSVVAAELYVGVKSARNPAWLASPNARAAMHTTYKGTGGPPVWDDNTVLGWPGYASQIVTPDAAVIHGPFANMVIAVHGVELLIDDVTRAGSGLIVATVFVLLSVSVMHPSSFCVISGFTTPAVP